MGNDGASLLTKSDWLTVRQAARQLGNVSTKLVYKLFHAGELAGVKVAGTVRIRAASVAAYLEAHSNQKPAAAEAAGAVSEQVRTAPLTRKRTRRSRSQPLAFVHLRPQE